MAYFQTKNIQYARKWFRGFREVKNQPGLIGDIVADEIEEQFNKNIKEAIFISGFKKDDLYSNNPIKAYKLSRVGWATVSNGQLIIDGKNIDRTGWAWGSNWQDEYPQMPSGTSTAQWPTHVNPVPVFLGGYEQWRRKYLGLQTSQVDHTVTGGLKKAINVTWQRSTGSNQYIGRYVFNLDIPSGMEKQLNYLLGLRNWAFVRDSLLREVGKVTQIDI